jgi:hypothetical protein
MDAKNVSSRFAAERESLLESTAEIMRQQGDFSDEDMQSTLSKVAEICQGKLPATCDVEYFNALCWLGEAVGEKVEICPFQDFRRLSYLDAVGIWPWFRRFPPPFSLPNSEENVSQAGFLPWTELESFALPEFSQLPDTDDSDVLNARDEFRYVLETLIPDKLDLLAVLQ